MPEPGGAPELVGISVAHFTAVHHLPSIIADGLVCDDAAQAGNRILAEAGDPDIKDRRRNRLVPVPPFGTVSSYVPFYFAPRSPMMYKISLGQVQGYTLGQDPLIYLVSSIERLQQHGLEIVVTDGNASNTPTKFSPEPSHTAEMIDWPLMTAGYWNNTSDDPDRMRRRMAECLVKDRVPFTAIERIITRTAATAGRVQSVLDAAGVQLPVEVKPDWYYS
jgi:hypothetical protein